jgi:hypothetical protein
MNKKLTNCKLYMWLNPNIISIMSIRGSKYRITGCLNLENSQLSNLDINSNCYNLHSLEQHKFSIEGFHLKSSCLNYHRLCNKMSHFHIMRIEYSQEKYKECIHRFHLADIHLKSYTQSNLSMSSK